MAVGKREPGRPQYVILAVAEFESAPACSHSIFNMARWASDTGGF
jgi:hypothetical protein